MDSTDPLILSDEEISQITGKKRPAYQRTVLAEMGINFTVRPNGSLVVSRRHFEYVLGGELDRMFLGFPEPDFGSLN